MIQFERRHGVPQCTLKNFEEDYADRHLLHGLVEKWAREQPDAIAIVNASTGKEYTWKTFEQTTTALALKLVDMGYRKGDFLASSLPLLSEHVFLEYACFKIGVVWVPLDLRLKGAEVIRSLGLVKAKGYCFLGNTPHADFRELGRVVQQHCPFVKDFIQFSAPEETIDGALNAFVVAGQAEALAKQAMANPAGSEILKECRQRPH